MAEPLCIKLCWMPTAPPPGAGGGVAGQKNNDMRCSQTQITLYKIGLKLVIAVMVI